MMKFSETLATLENSEHIQKIELLQANGAKAGVIENKPGSQGSVKNGMPNKNVSRSD